MIVGGGLTGCTSAYSFAAAGTRPLLLEADRLGRGASGRGRGNISDDPGVDFGALERAIGRRSALKAWQTWRRAALDFQALLRRLDVKCGLEPRPLMTIARSGEEAARLKREQSVRSAARVEAALVPASRATAEAGIPAQVGLRSRDSAIDPYRATIGLAAAAAARGARIYERTAVERITFTRKFADVVTGSGTIRTTRVIIATSLPTRLFRSLERHFWFKRSFSAMTAAIPAAVRRRLGDRDVLIRDLAAPAHLIRWVDDESLLVTGADADPTRPNLEPKILVQRTGQLMYELSTLYPEISGIRPITAGTPRTRGQRTGSHTLARIETIRFTCSLLAIPPAARPARILPVGSSFASTRATRIRRTPCSGFTAEKLYSTVVQL